MTNPQDKSGKKPTQADKRGLYFDQPPASAIRDFMSDAEIQAALKKGDTSARVIASVIAWDDLETEAVTLLKGDVLKDPAVLSFVGKIHAVCMKNKISPLPEIYIAHPGKDPSGGKGYMPPTIVAGKIGNKSIIVINESLLNAFNSDEEIGAAIHEVGHLFHKHAARSEKIDQEYTRRMESLGDPNAPGFDKKAIEVNKWYAGEQQKKQMEADMFAINNGFARELYAALQKDFKEQQQDPSRGDDADEAAMLQARIQNAAHHAAKQEKNNKGK